MRRSDLIDFVSNAFYVPRGTVAEYARALSAAGMLTVGKSGPHGHGARMTTHDAVNLILACAVNSKYKESNGVLGKESVVERVQRVRGLRSDGQPRSDPADFAPDLPFFQADTAGAALDALLDAARTGQVVRWANHKPYFFVVVVESRGNSVTLGLDLDGDTAIRGFGEQFHSLVERESRLSFMLLAKLAAALGPLPDIEKARNA